MYRSDKRINKTAIKSNVKYSLYIIKSNTAKKKLICN